MNEIANGYESVQKACLNIQALEPDHANLFPYLTSQMDSVKIWWKIILLKFKEFEERKARTASEPPQEVRNDHDEDTEKSVSKLNENISTIACKVSSVEETTLPLAPPQNQPSRPGLEGDVGSQ